MRKKQVFEGVFKMNSRLFFSPSNQMAAVSSYKVDSFLFIPNHGAPPGGGGPYPDPRTRRGSKKQNS
jgi:hypothetical protein